MTLRSDNGAEFKNIILDAFYKEKCISQQFSAPRTPQQNDIVEIKNRTLIEVARTMLLDAKLPTSFWAEAINTACYMQNKTLINKRNGKISFFLMFGKKESLKQLHVFGSKCYILKNQSKYLEKFDSKAL